MLTSRQKKIIRYLKDTDRWVKGNELSRVIGVTDRTVRNDILAIKKIHGDDIIDSSKTQGYKFNTDLENELNISKNKEIIEPIHRIIYMTKLLLISIDGVNIYDLAEELFVSESTIESDIVRLKKIIYELSGEKIIINREKEILKLIIVDNAYIGNLLYDVMKYEKYDFTIKDTERYFKDFDINLLYETLARVLRKHNYSSRYMSLKNITLTIAILMEKHKLNNLTCDKVSDYEEVGILHTEIYKEINEHIKLEFNIDISNNEISQLAMYTSNVYELELIENQIRNCDISLDSIYELYKEIFKNIKEQYLLDLTQYENIIRDISTHTKIAIERINKGVFIHNPLKDRIINQYPFLFNIGISISKLIFEHTGVLFNSDETSYLVAYLAGAIESLKRNCESDNKLNILLVVLEGRANLNYIYSNIINLGENINVTGISTLSEMENVCAYKCGYDLVISTSSLDICNEVSSIIITSSFTIIDQIKVRECINKVVELKKRQNFDNMFNHFFNENIFVKEINVSNKEEGIKSLINILKSKEYIDDTFEESVFEREALVPTSIETGIALPHATDAKSLKTGVAVGILKNTVNWSGNKVKVILLFATTKDDVPKLNNIYDYIAKISIKIEYIDEIKKCVDFQSFKNTLERIYFKEYI